MMLLPQDSDFQRLPIQPEEGFPQAFVLSFAGKLYRLTLRVSCLTLEPFKVWEAGSAPTAERLVRRALSLPVSTSGTRAQLPWEIQREPERMMYVLPQEHLYLVLQVERDDVPEGQRVQGVTRPALDIPVRVGDLVFLFRKIHIARGNLLGPGNYGSDILAGVATYGG
jgi:hypothetical protein